MLDPQILFWKPKIICNPIIVGRIPRKMFEIDVKSFHAENTLKELEFFFANYTD